MGVEGEEGDWVVVRSLGGRGEEDKAMLLMLPWSFQLSTLLKNIIIYKGLQKGKAGKLLMDWDLLCSVSRQLSLHSNL